MTTVALLVNPDRAQARRIAGETMSWLASKGVASRMLTLAAGDRVAEGGTERTLEDVDFSAVDIAVSLGGDGTFLRLVAVASGLGVPLLGVNFGRLGYLLDTPADRVPEALDRFFGGHAEVQERALLDVIADGEILPLESPATGSGSGLPGEAAPVRRQWRVLNEAVVEKAVPGHMVHLVTSVDGERLAAYRADGVLVATPTGSTAYNLSAGGPVLSPLQRAAIVTPVAAHLSSGSSVVLDADYAVTLQVTDGRPAVLVLDGLAVARLEPSASVTCKIATQTARLVRFGRQPLAQELGAVLAPVPLRPSPD